MDKKNRVYKIILVAAAVVMVVLCLIYAGFTDYKNSRYTRNLKNYSGTIAIDVNSNYVEYDGDYKVDVYNLFGFSPHRQMAYVMITKKGDDMNISFKIRENLLGEFRYTVEYAEAPKVILENETETWTRAGYNRRGSFDINENGELLSVCGDRKLTDSEMEKYQEIYESNKDIIKQLIDKADSYWDIGIVTE